MRDHLRALLITAHLVVLLMLALPQPGAFMHERAWKRPDAQQAIRAGASILNAVGFDTTPAEVHATAWDVGIAWRTARRSTVKYVQPYVDYCGTKQSWTMFAGVADRSGRLEVEVELDGEWEVVYIPQVQDHGWQGRALRQERMRAYLSDFARKNRKGIFPRLVDALALRAAADFPDATRLRARMRTVHTPDPATLRQTGERRLGEPYWETTVFLSEWR